MIRHIRMDIEGAIENAKTLRGCITVGDHTLDTVVDVRAWLYQQKKKGYRVLPMGYCKGFDFQNGCPGHESKEECEVHEAICKIANAICTEEECEHWCGVYTDCKAYQDAKKIYEERKQNDKTRTD